MKIRHPWLITAIGFCAALVIRLLMRTVRYRHRGIGETELLPYLPNLPGRYIYASWHEDLLLLGYDFSKAKMHVLVSQSADGLLIATALRWLGWKIIPGSSSRGGAEALLKMVKVAKTSHIGITTDGPRGPRQRVQSGIVYVAARTGLPIVPLGVGYAKAWRARSWDRLAFPKPLSKAVFVSMPPIHVPNTKDKEVLESYRQQVEEAMLQATHLAQAEAQGEQPAEWSKWQVANGERLAYRFEQRAA